jgi:type 1 fimbria pilin
MGMAMKNVRYVWIFSVMLAMLPAIVSATATINVNFQGAFVAPTCNFSVTNANIGTYPTTYFNTNTSTPTTQLTVTASGCTTGISTIHLYFSGAADASNNHLFAVNSGSGVQGVAIELLYNAQSTQIWPNTSVNWVGVNPSQTGTWNFWAHFYKTTGTITSGTVNVPITINFTYN